ncbi:MAG: DUF3795 domain-containing protein [Dehalococcoidia bacterium]
MKRALNEKLIAPCGMNCGVCMAYLREKNRCPGCRGNDTDKPISCVRCKIINCETLAKSKSKFCFECEKRCARLKQLDKRYRTKYGMSMIENLEFIRDKGMDKFLRWQAEKYKCPKCGGVICVHNKKCYDCNYIESGSS